MANPGSINLFALPPEDVPNSPQDNGKRRSKRGLLCINFPESSQFDPSASEEITSVLFCRTCKRNVVVEAKSVLAPNLVQHTATPKTSDVPHFHVVLCRACADGGETLAHLGPRIKSGQRPTIPPPSWQYGFFMATYTTGAKVDLRPSETQQEELGPYISDILLVLGFPDNCVVNLDIASEQVTSNPGENIPRFLPWDLLQYSRSEDGTGTPEMKLCSVDTSSGERASPVTDFLYPGPVLCRTPQNLLHASVYVLFVLFCGKCLRSAAFKTSMALFQLGTRVTHESARTKGVADILFTLCNACELASSSIDSGLDGVLTRVDNAILRPHIAGVDQPLMDALTGVRSVIPCDPDFVNLNEFALRPGQLRSQKRTLLDGKEQSVLIWDRNVIAGTLWPTALAFGIVNGAFSQSVPDHFFSG